MISGFRESIFCHYLGTLSVKGFYVKQIHSVKSSNFFNLPYLQLKSESKQVIHNKVYIH